MDLLHWQRTWAAVPWPATLGKTKARTLGFAFCCLLDADARCGYPVFASNDHLAVKFGVDERTITRMRKDAVEAGCLVRTGEFRFTRKGHKIEILKPGWPG